MSPSSPELTYFEVMYASWVKTGMSPAETAGFLMERDDDPQLALPCIGVLRRWLDDLEDGLVNKARAEGRSWADIGRNLGRTRQAVWERHHDTDAGDAGARLSPSWSPRRALRDRHKIRIGPQSG